MTKRIEFSEEDVAEIIRLYVEEEIIPDKICMIFGVSSSVIRRILKKNNIKTNKPSTKYPVRTGQIYGKLTIIEEIERNEQGIRQVVAQCSCDGNIRAYNWYCVARGETKSCGCYNQEKRSERAKARAKNVIGKRYHKMTVIEELDRNKWNQRQVIAQCDCGTIKECALGHLQNGNIKSCGCWRIEELKSRDRTSQSRKRKLYKADYQEKHPLFYKIEEIRDSKDGDSIEVRCKMHSCRKWFKPKYKQIQKRIQAINGERGNGEDNFYCSEECKKECPSYGLNSNSIKYNNLNKRNVAESKFTQYELKVFRKEVKRRQFEEFGYNFCEIKSCKNKGPYFVHHERPKKQDWIFGLDPDNGTIACREHHEELHEGECSYSTLAKLKCE